MAALLGGCASDGYLGDRARDAADCFTLTLSLGPELSADTKLTEALHLAVGGGFHAEAGVIRGDVGSSTFITLGLPISPFVTDGGLHNREPFLLRTGAWEAQHIKDRCWGIHALGLPGTSPRRSLIDRFDLELGAMALVGARAGFSPGQFVDFLAGVVGVDLASDDAPQDTAGELAADGEGE